MGGTEPDVVFSYWRGVVPSIAELHFRSFLANSTTARYHLWLDETTASSALGPRLRSILRHPRVDVRTVNLDSLAAATGVPPIGRPLPGPLRWLPRLLRGLIAVVPRRKWPLAIALVGRFVRAIRIGQIQKDHGWFAPFHHLRFLANPNDATYLADLFRCLALAGYAGRSVLYLDLDTVVNRPLATLDWTHSFTYRWDQESFANNAIMFLAAGASGRIAEMLIERLREQPVARPWALFEANLCDELGIAIRPASAFDPPWDPQSEWRGDPTAFFRASPGASAIVRELLDRFPIAHWHNQWTTAPEAGSPYALLLSAVSRSGLPEDNETAVANAVDHPGY